MFRLPDSWVWDFWLADDGQSYHLFFLFASRALHDPEARHLRASVGHAVSADLVEWRRVEDAIVRADPPAFDDVATWTGSVVRHTDGTWFMFYTGGSRTDLGMVQTIGYATSPDLYSWVKNPDNPVLRADGTVYETLEAGLWSDEAFRDPWVFPDPAGAGWHMLITCRANQGPSHSRGVVGHGRSTDLREWTLLPPLSPVGAGFAQLEVLQVEVVDGQPVLIFSCLPSETTPPKWTPELDAGVWMAPAESVLGPYDLAAAQPITGQERYSGRVIRDRANQQWVLLTFNRDVNSDGFGQLDDPVPLPRMTTHPYRLG